MFLRQRVRWARGLVQTLYLHKSVFFNPKYGKTGLLVFPYFVFYEFCTYFRSYWNNSIDIRLLFFNINLDYLIGTAFVYLFYITITLISVFLDQIIYKHYTGIKEVLIY
jgi:cellulose synthase/poly-beta-1,6-N-acetylglucosamine synthase-like glycosyltransferase